MAAYLAAATVTALLLWNAATTFALMWIGTSALPFGDQWDTSLLPDELIRNLFAQHNEHRPAVARLVGWLDWYLADARNAMTATFIALCHVVFGLVLFRLVHMVVKDWRGAALISALATAIVVADRQTENLLWGFQTAFVGSFAAALLALFCAVITTTARSSAGRMASFAACLVASGVSVFSLASGVLTLVFVTILLFLASAPLVFRAGYSLFSIGLIAFYLHDYSRPTYHTNPWVAIHHGLKLARYTAAYLGAPFAEGRRHIAVYFGAWGALLVAGLLIWSAVSYRRERRSNDIRGIAAYYGLILFTGLIGCAALMTGLGRLDFGLGQAMSVRYGTPASMFWGVLVAALIVSPAIRGRWPSRVVQGYGVLLATGLAVFVATQQLKYMPKARDMHRDKLLGGIAYLVGLRSGPEVLHIYPIASRVAEGHLDEAMQRLKESHKSIFSYRWANLLGLPLGELRGEPVSGCHGAVDQATLVQAGEAPISKVAGWAWNDRSRRSPDLIILTGQDGTISGFGVPGFRRLGGGQGQSGMPDNNGWTGFARGGDADMYHAFEIYLGKTARICELAEDQG